MNSLLFFSIILSIIVTFMLIYVSTLHLFPKEWRDRVNSNTRSINPKYNNDSLTGFIIIILTAVTSISWTIYFYFYLF